MCWKQWHQNWNISCYPLRQMTRTSRVPQLDGLRGLAILLVLIWHYVACQMDPKWGSLGLETFGFRVADTLHALISMTWSGVDLFFVLSGFLLGGILMDHKTSPSFFMTFYVRRVCRLFPLYYLLLLLFGLTTLAPLSQACPGLNWLFDHPLPMWSYATFTQNFQMAFKELIGANWLGVTWSLAVEEQFYLILPLIGGLYRPSKPSFRARNANSRRPFASRCLDVESTGHRCNLQLCLDGLQGRLSPAGRSRSLDVPPRRCC